MVCDARGCPAGGRPFPALAKPYRLRQHLKREPIPGCRHCRYLRRLPIPQESNQLGQILYERIRNEGPSLAGWAMARGLKPITIRQVLTGERRYLAVTTITRIAHALPLPVPVVQGMVPGTMEQKHHEQGLAHAASQDHAALAEGRRQSELWHERVGAHMKRLWRRRRKHMRTVARRGGDGSAAKVGPASRARQLYGIMRRKQPGPLSPAVLDQWATRCAKPFTQGGLPRLYLRATFYGFANLKWPGPHPRSLGHRPDVKRFELVYPLKRQGKTWRQIAPSLATKGDIVKHAALARWWAQFWR